MSLFKWRICSEGRCFTKRSSLISELLRTKSSFLCFLTASYEMRRRSRLLASFYFLWVNRYSTLCFAAKADASLFACRNQHTRSQKKTRLSNLFYLSITRLFEQFSSAIFLLQMKSFVKAGLASKESFWPYIGLFWFSHYRPNTPKYNSQRWVDICNIVDDIGFISKRQYSGSFKCKGR